MWCWLKAMWHTFWHGESAGKVDPHTQDFIDRLDPDAPPPDTLDQFIGTLGWAGILIIVILALIYA